MIIWVMHSLAEGENENWFFEGAFYTMEKALRTAIETETEDHGVAKITESYISPVGNYARYTINGDEYEISSTTIQ
jgi:hypothetical protein